MAVNYLISPVERETDGSVLVYSLIAAAGKLAGQPRRQYYSADLETSCLRQTRIYNAQERHDCDPGGISQSFRHGHNNIKIIGISRMGEALNLNRIRNVRGVWRRHVSNRESRGGVGS